MYDTAIEYRDISQKITQLLQNKAPMRLSISAISRELGIHRGAIAKHLEMLQIVGDVSMVPFGKSKLYTVSRRIPYFALLDVYSDAVVVLEGSGCIEMVNKKFCLMFDIVKEKDVKGRNITNMDLYIFRESHILNNIRRMMNGSPYEGEIQYIEESTKRVFDIRFIPTVSNNGNANYMVIVSDITHQKQREDDFLHTEKMLKTIFDKVQVGIMFIGAEGNVMNANKASLDLLGLNEPSSYSALNVFSIISDIDTMKNMLKNDLITEFTIICNFGDLRDGGLATEKSGTAYFEMTLAPIDTTMGGKLLREYAVLFNDITADVNTLREINRKEARYRSFFENTYNGMQIFRMDSERRDLIYEDINKAAEILLSVKKEEILGKRVGDLFPDTRDIQSEEFDRVISDGIPQVLRSVQYVKGDNQPRFVHYMFLLPSGEFASIIMNETEEIKK